VIVADAELPLDESVWIVAEGRLSAAALAALLASQPGYRMVREVRGTAALAEAFAGFRPAVLVVDGEWFGWPLSVDAGDWGGRTLLLLDPADEPARFVHAARSGARGFLSRSASGKSLVLAIETLRTCGYSLDPLLAEGIVLALRDAPAPPSTRPSLSDYERDILIRVASGRSSKEIAREYAITAKTVGNHLANLCQKLNLNHRGELVLYAAAQGLATLDSPVAGTTIPFKKIATLS
jgi:DNA-binding NarL/FixJ family response regulator